MQNQDSAGGTRTPNQLVNSQLLFRLSYRGHPLVNPAGGGTLPIELPRRNPPDDGPPCYYTNRRAIC